MNSGEKELYKTVIVIWSEEDPEDMGLTDLALDAEAMGSFLSKRETELIEFPELDLDWDDTDIFDDEPEVAMAVGASKVVSPKIGRSTSVPYLRVVK